MRSQGFRNREGTNTHSMVERHHIQRLVEALRTSDRGAVDELLPPLRARLVRVAKQRVQEELVEEVVQETLATVWEKRESLPDADRVLPFVFQVLRNKIGNVYLRARRTGGRHVGLDEAAAAPAEAPFADPVAQAEAAELERVLGEAMERCGQRSEKNGEMLELLWAGRSPAQMQRELGGISMSTLLSRTHRARRMLREVLADEFGVGVLEPVAEGRKR